MHLSPSPVTIAPLIGDESDWEALAAEFEPRQQDSPVFHFVPPDFFLTILKHRKLSLKRIDLFTDELDGLPPVANLTSQSPMAANLKQNLVMIEDPSAQRRDNMILRSRSFAHCWYRGIPDDEKMWTEYAEAGRGVCICSSTHRLISSLEPRMPAHLEFHIGKCYYRDESQPTPDLWMTNSLYRKRERFSGEKELRVVGIVRDDWWEREREAGLISLPQRESIPVCIETLIRALIVGPSMGDDVYREIRLEFDSLGFEPQIVRRR